VKHGGDVMADLPIKELGDEAPLYDRPHVPSPLLPVVHARDVKPPIGITPALERLIATPELCSKRWVWEQYDHVILGNTVQRPGGDAAVVRVQDGPKGLALTVDVTPRYCEADPYQGGMQAVAEAWRNITAVGGRPLAITDNLNFGNPERPEIMGQFVGCLKGISEACRALDFPVVSGNVSLYNETRFPGEELGRGILPTPSIGGVGLLDDFTKSATLAFKAGDEAILLIGETHGWLGQSVYLRDICGREEGAPPPVDLAAEKRNGDVVRGMIHAGTATAAHDVSDGGLLIALAEMAMAGATGARLLAAPREIVPHAYWFGEDQARYIVTVPGREAGRVLAKMKGCGVPCVRIGTSGGETIAIAGEAPVSVSSLKTGFEGWFPAYMNGKAS
jgi:phosphoribosylformylglycinamidine synthase subunit PurL